MENITSNSNVECILLGKDAYLQISGNGIWPCSLRMTGAISLRNIIKLFLGRVIPDAGALVLRFLVGWGAAGSIPDTAAGSSSSSSAFRFLVALIGTGGTADAAAISALVLRFLTALGVIGATRSGVARSASSSLVSLFSAIVVGLPNVPLSRGD